MQGLTYFAIYFIIWWLTLFAMLPIGLRTQAEDDDVAIGTVRSAPSKFKAIRVFLMTTIVSLLLFAGWYVVTQVFGFGPDSLPRFFPNFAN